MDGIKIKPLVWFEKPQGQDCRIGRCEHIAYAVERRGDFWGFRRSGENGLVVAVGAENAFRTEAEAMAGADRDHIKRIRAALAPTDAAQARSRCPYGATGDDCCGGYCNISLEDETPSLWSGDALVDKSTGEVLSLNPTDAAHVNETPKSEHDGADVLTDAAQAREAALIAALQWCSGSDDFQEGGKAREGWLKLCAPLLHGEART